MSKKVLLTGGSRGIGKAISEVLIKNNYEVIMPSRSELNLLDNNSINEFIEKNKNFKFDIIINNAGINPLGKINEIRDEDFDMTVQINLKAPLKIIKGFVENMKSKKAGKIINISSIWGIVSKEGRTTYSITKNGINGLTKTLAVELGEYGILVNSVAPGYVNTELTKQNVSENDAIKIKENIPLKRFAEPEEIAKFIMFLISDENTYITGQVIAIDGGYTVK